MSQNSISRNSISRNSASRHSIGLAALALAATTLLGACSDMYLDRRETVSFAAGDAIAANKVVHMIDPWPAHAGNRNISHDGERMAKAAERYRTDQVKPLASSSTSSVQYTPVLAPVSK